MKFQITAWIKFSGVCLLLTAVILSLAACGGHGLNFGGGAGRGTLKAAGIASVTAPMDVAQILAELDALKPPAGADEATFAMLKTAVADALQQRAASRVTSAAPGATLGQVDAAAPLDAGQYSISFSWDERNPGDYDLNGEVNAKDLSVLAIHFGKQESAEGWAQARVADGNGDGVLDNQDAVVIAENYLSRISGYNVYRSLPGGSSPEMLGRIMRDEAVVLGGVLVQYHFEDTAIDSPGQTFVYEVHPFANPDGTGEGIASQSFTLRAGGSFGLPSVYAQETVADVTGASRLAVAGEVLLTFPSQPKLEQLLNAVYEQVGGELLGQIPGTFTYRVRLPKDASRTVSKIAAKTKAASSAGYVIEPNYLVPGPAPVEKIAGDGAGSKSSSMAYSDPLRDQLWGMDAVYANAAWDVSEGQGVVVAVIDTGVETSHEDLAGQTVTGARFGGSEPWDDDSAGHGTHVAGTIAATGGNSKGVVGLANKVLIMPLRCGALYGGNWSFPVADLTAAVNFAVQNGAKVINMSLGGQGTLGTAFETALASAESNGVVVCAAAGNDNVSAQGFYPATYPTVLSVGAVGPALQRAPFSNYGYPQYVKVCAPGGDGTFSGAILSSIPTTTSSYERMQGTSMACPHATAEAALILSVAPSLTPAQVRQVMHDTGRNIAATAQVGPLINAQAALDSLGAAGTNAISGSVKRADSSAVAGVTINLSGAASRSATTDASGNFTLAGVADGSYTLTPSKAGYSFTPASLSVVVSGASVSGQNFTAAQGAGIEAENNDTTAQANQLPDLPFSADKFSGSLGSGTGYVANDGDATDIMKFTITAPTRVSFTLNFNPATANLDLRLLSTNGSTILVTSATTAAPETVSASLITAGTYFIKCSRVTGYSDYTIAATAAPAYSVTGKVTKKADGKPLAGTVVKLTGGAITLSATSNAAGDYTINGVPDGSYTLTPSQSGRSYNPPSASVTVSDGNVTGVNFQAEGPFTVTGAVYLKSGTALAGATLTLAGSGPSLTATSGADGKFTISNVLNGSYTLTCLSTGRSFTPSSISVNVTSGSVAGCYFLGEGPFSVAGTVANPFGAPLAGVALKLVGNGYNLSGTTTSLGKFTVAGAPNGTYTLTPSSKGRTFTPASLSVTVQSGNVTGLAFTGEGPFNASGKVTNRGAGTALSGAKITLTGGGLTLSAMSDINGLYTITYIPNGTYTLTATRAGRLFTPATRSITVAGANVAAQDFAAYSVFSVSGQVTLANPAPAGVSLTLAGNGMTYTVQSDAQGMYTFAGVPPGNYVLTPRAGGKALKQVSRAITVSSANLAAVNISAN